eukprot:5333572-Pyramimonas_sp.AAC.2
MECDICRSTQYFRRECPRGDGGGRGSSMHLAQTDSDMQRVDWETRLADPAGNPTQSLTSWLPGASMSLETCAGELFEEIYVGHDQVIPADWLGIRSAGQPARVESVEDAHIPADVDHFMAGAPADSEAAIPATRGRAHDAPLLDH